MAFTWVEFYLELSKKLLTYRDRQAELLAFLRNLKQRGHKVIKLTDRYPDHQTEIDLDEIDPFTFFANFNRGITKEHRIGILAEIRSHFGITAAVPKDFKGIPIGSNMKSWFFSWKYNRGDQASIMWDLANAVVSGGPGELDPRVYEAAARVKGLGPGMITMGMFWLNPAQYMALDGVILDYLDSQGIQIKKRTAKTLQGYLSILEQVRKQFTESFYELSYKAWQKKTNPDPPEGPPEGGPSTPPEPASKGRRYWVYSPGRRAKYWEECRDQGIMVYGADELPVLTSFTSRVEIQAAIKEKYGRAKEPIMDSLAAWDFSRTLKPGDVVIPKRGNKTYLGYGIVTGDYYHDPTRAKYQHVRKIAWKKAGEWIETKGPIVQKTLTDITKYPEYVDRLRELIGIGDDVGAVPTGLALNTILFGPPGTGKTYRIRNDFFGQFTDSDVQSRDDFLDKLVEGMTWWEVITIAMLELETARVSQILKHPVIEARIRASQNRNPRAAVWAHLQMHTKTDCPHVKYTKRYDPFLFWKDENSVWTIDQRIAKDEVPELEEKLEAYQEFQPREAIERRYVFTTFHQSYTYEDFVEGIKPILVDDADVQSDDHAEIAYKLEPGVFRRIAAAAAKNPSKKYAIFIDEINRGNIASIFGELITLIEEDKRAGAKNELAAVLPYSRDEFRVPGNLYLVGTMNTADRSVDALDTALRRRFSFVEMLPQPELVSQPEDLEVDLQKMLTTMNRRIEKLVDKDHRIGHAYLMNFVAGRDSLDQLREIFANKVLPLLGEYFYNDPSKLGMVLGKSFVRRKRAGVTLASGDWESEDFEEKEVFEVVDPKDLDAEAFKSIYE